MMACLFILILIASSSLLVISIMQLPIDVKPETGLSFLGNYPEAIVQRDFQLSIEEHRQRDLEWRHALTYNKIIDTVNIGHHGLAKKYVFILEGGYVAMAKPVQRDLIIYPHSAFTTFSWEKEQPRSAVRMDRDFQGWGELCGVALDRILGWYRKPTVSGRYIDSKLLYYHDYSTWGRILYALPSHQVPVAMHAWVTGLSTRAPSSSIGRYLTFRESKSIVDTEKALEYSDVLVFDFLIDDHDRLGNHNWKLSADNKLFVWDSGLAWNYGPTKADTEVLCGTHSWNGDDPFTTAHDIKRPNCTRICVFRRETIETLWAVGPNAEPENKLGRLLEKQLSSDILEHHFEYGIYKVKRSGFLWWFYAAARFTEEDFYNGMDTRVDILLQHVDQCIETYGIDNVLQ